MQSPPGIKLIFTFVTLVNWITRLDYWTGSFTLNCSYVYMLALTLAIYTCMYTVTYL